MKERAGAALLTPLPAGALPTLPLAAGELPTLPLPTGAGALPTLLPPLGAGSLPAAPSTAMREVTWPRSQPRAPRWPRRRRRACEVCGGLGLVEERAVRRPYLSARGSEVGDLSICD